MNTFRLAVRQNAPGENVYDVIDRGAVQPPSYGRVISALSNSDVLNEIELGRGEPEYQNALRAEAQKRGLQ